MRHTVMWDSGITLSKPVKRGCRLIDTRSIWPMGPRQETTHSGYPPFDISDDVAVEQRYRRSGLPLLIEDFSTQEDVLGRLTPLLVLMFVIDIVVTLVGAGTWEAGLGIVAGLGIFVAGNAIVQTRQGRRWSSLPRRVGVGELALLLLTPFFVRLIAGRTFGNALLDLVVDSLIVAVLVGFANLGLGSIVTWAFRHVYRQARSIAPLAVRTLPIIMLTVLFFFFTGELWQLIHNLSVERFYGAMAVFGGVGSAFLIGSLVATHKFTAFKNWSDVRTSAKAVGATNIPHANDLGPGKPTLSPTRRLRANIGLVMFFSQALQVIIMFALVTAALIGIGILLVRPATLLQWIGEEPRYLFESDGERQLAWEVLTEELMMVSAFVGAFAALQFAVQVANSGVDDSGTIHKAAANVRGAIAVRCIREHLRDQHVLAPKLHPRDPILHPLDTRDTAGEVADADAARADAGEVGPDADGAGARADAGEVGPDADGPRDRPDKPSATDIEATLTD